MGHWLFEPSGSVTGVKERRRARLVSKLLLAQAVLLIHPIAFIKRTEAGRSGELLHALLIAYSGCVLVCYALSRSRQVRVAVWTYAISALGSPRSSWR